VELAIGPSGDLSGAAEMEIGMTRIADRPSAVIGREGSHGLVFLGHIGLKACA
jgi:hypothetical protein